MSVALAAAAAAAGGCCRRGEDEARAEPRASASAPAEARPAARAASASRCGECHGGLEASWRGSGHARSATAPLYEAMQRRSADEACARCHEPLKGPLGGDALAREGVSCEVCHTINEVQVGPTAGQFSLRLGEAIKYGTLCDAKDHYFHRMGCSPLHHEATLCAGCHLWKREGLGGKALPVHTEYEEWLASPYPAAGVACQGCHMPAEAAEVATGWGMRPRVGEHQTMGEGEGLRRRALAVRAEAAAEGQRVRVEVRLRNDGAGHAVPTGLPERRVVLRVTVVDEAGNQTGAGTAEYGRVLVDDAGALAPFYAATRVAADTRIEPRQARSASFTLQAPAGAGKVQVEVLWRSAPHELSAALGAAATPDVSMAKLELAFGPAAGAGRKLLPRSAEVAP